MKITFDPTDCDIGHTIFKTPEEWEAYIKPLTAEQKKVYSPQPLDIFPDRFPCLMLYDSSFIINNEYGNDKFPNFFIYSFTVDDEDDEAEG